MAESTTDRHELARDTVEQIISLMGANASVEIEAVGEQIELSISGPDASSLIGKKGKTLDALQFVTNRIVGRQPGEHKLIVLDSDGYRKRREASLVQLAERLSTKVRDEGKIIRLNPMSARDRRIIHMTLRDHPNVSTRSEGEGDDRRLLIVPER